VNIRKTYAIRLNLMKIGLDCIVGDRFQTSVSFRVVYVPCKNTAGHVSMPYHGVLWKGEPYPFDERIHPVECYPLPDGRIILW
jgi:hypothetical protein